MAMSLRRTLRPLTGALHSLVPAAGASRTAGARRALTLARRVAAPAPLRANARRTLALARPTEDADSVQFPREGPGLDYALNWSLCGDGVVPSKLAYRITKVQTAEQLLCYQVARHNVPVSLQPACLARVRADTVIEEKDLLATPKRPTDLKCSGRKGQGLPDHLKLNLVKRPADWSHGCPALHDFVQQHGGHTAGVPGNLDSTLTLAEVAERADWHVGFTPWQSFQGADETALPSQTAPCMVVLAYDRPDLLNSLLRRLNSLHYGADLGRVALTISIDAAPPDASQDVRSRVDLSVELARNFSFNAGVSRLRVRTSHAGMVGQWLDAWRPELDATDQHVACAILEDDLVPSRGAWNWMQGALDAYGNHLDRLASLSWQRQKLVAATQSDRGLGVMPPDTSSYGSDGRPLSSSSR